MKHLFQRLQCARHMVQNKLNLQNASQHYETEQKVNTSIMDTNMFKSCFVKKSVDLELIGRQFCIDRQFHARKRVCEIFNCFQTFAYISSGESHSDVLAINYKKKFIRKLDLKSFKYVDSQYSSI